MPRDLITSVQWVTMLDERVCPSCRPLEGLIWHYNTPTFGVGEPIGHEREYPGDSMHPRCRCRRAFITESFEDLNEDGELEDVVRGKIKEEKPKPKNKAEKEKIEAEVEKEVSETLIVLEENLDGKPPTFEDFDDFLRKQNEETQARILGPSRLILWKEGNISVSDMTDQSHRPITIQELANANAESGFLAAETEGLKSSGLIETLKPDRKPSRAVAVQTAALGRLRQTLGPDGDPRTAGFVRDFHGRNRSLSAAELLAAAIAVSLILDDEEKVAKTLRAAIKRAERGDPPTPAQAKVIESLRPEVRKNFDEWIKRTVETNS